MSITETKTDANILDEPTKHEQKLLDLIFIKLELCNPLIFDPDLDRHFDASPVQYLIIEFALGHAIIKVAQDISVPANSRIEAYCLIDHAFMS